ncbi:MAG: hypothetical protein IMX00_00635 [Limnochordales bacterium]|nr:hypothetical protein [Limnochordales bacterium]
MPERIILLAVTDMHNGYFCIAGVRDGRWVRPVLPGARQLTADDIQTDGKLWRPWDIIEVDRFFPVPVVWPHSEDLGFDPKLARCVGSIDDPGQRSDLLAQYACNDGSWLTLLNGEGRKSLCLLRAAQINWFPSTRNPSKQRAALVVGQKLYNGYGDGYSIVDHYASDWCNGKEKSSSAKAPYVLLGLSRRYNERFWPMVLRTFCAPSYR